MIKKKFRKTSNILKWQVTFNGNPGSIEWGVVLSEQASCRILNVKDLKVHLDDSIVITSGGRGGNDFIAQWNILSSTAAINDQNPRSKQPMLDWQDIGWLPLNLNKSSKKSSVKFGFHRRGVTYLQLKYCGQQPAGGQLRMLVKEAGERDGKQQPRKIPSSEMIVRITIVVS